LAVEGGAGADGVNFREDGGVFGLNRDALRIGDGAGAGFGGQGNGAVEQSGDLGERAIGELQFTDAVVGIAHGLGQGGDVGLQPIGNGQSGGIVCTGVDA